MVDARLIEAAVLPATELPVTLTGAAGVSVGIDGMGSCVLRASAKNIRARGVSSPALTVTVQESADGSSWSTLHSFSLTPDSPELEVAADSSASFLRASWSVGAGAWGLPSVSVVPFSSASGGGTGGDSSVIGPGDSYVFVGNGSLVTVPSGNAQPVAMDTISLDPQGWLGSGSYDSPDWWGRTFPEGSWLLLPAGVYWAEVSYQWDTDPLNSQGWFADIDNRFNDNIDLWQALSANPLHQPIASANLSDGFAWKWSSLFRVRETGAPYHWGLSAQHGQATDVTLDSINLGVMRLSQFGGT